MSHFERSRAMSSLYCCSCFGSAHVTTAGDSLPLVNLIGRFKPAAPQRLLFLAHWDSRPHADAEGPLRGLAAGDSSTWHQALAIEALAALSVAIIPVLILYALFSRQLIRGLTSGAVK